MQFISTKVDIRYLPDDMASAFILFEEEKFPLCLTNRLNYLKDIPGIGVFTARPGMRKSYALRCFASGLNPSLYHMEYLCLSTISIADFYKQLCAILGVSDKGGKTGMFQSIQQQITYLYKEKRQPLLRSVSWNRYPQ